MPIMKVTEGRVRQGMWKDFETAYKRVVDAPVPGLLARYLVWDIDDRDHGHSITIWESLEAMRSYQDSDLFQKTIQPALQPFFGNDSKTSVAEIALQKSSR